MNGKDAERLVSVPLEQAVEAARLLESVVVSLDRIGSRMAAGDAEELRERNEAQLDNP